MPWLREHLREGVRVLVASCARGPPVLLGSLGVADLTQLSEAAKGYLLRLEEWSLQQAGKREAWVKAYWTTERREAYRIQAIKQHGKPRKPVGPLKAIGFSNRQIVRVDPDLPDSTTIYRSFVGRRIYHLRKDCPLIGRNASKIGKGRLGGQRAAGRPLCAFESWELHRKRGVEARGLAS